MSDRDSRTTVVDAARRLFAEHGYSGVTIRDVAAEAQLSPAMVMKVMGSKAQLYAEAKPLDADRIPADLPLEELGHELVRRVFDRFDHGVAEPWAQAAHLTRTAPDTAASRAEFHDGLVSKLARRIGTDAESVRRAELVACLMVGLATGLRTLGLVDTTRRRRAALVEEYAGLVQQVLDRPRA